MLTKLVSQASNCRFLASCFSNVWALLSCKPPAPCLEMILLLQVEPQPDGSKPISQTPGQGSPRLASLYAILGLPLAMLGAALLLVPGLVGVPSH
jgi:hypothetical protein